MAIELLSLVTPVADLTPEARQNVVRQTILKVEGKALAIPAFKGTTLIVRQLAGNDLGLTTQVWNETVSRTAGTANTYEDSAINGTTARDRYIGIYGVYVASSVDSVSSLRFVVGGRRTHQWDLQAVIHEEPWTQTREQRTLYAYAAQSGEIDPVLIPPNTTILVRHYVRGGTGVGIQAAELVLLGIVIEPFGGGGAELQPNN